MKPRRYLISGPACGKMNKLLKTKQEYIYIYNAENNRHYSSYITTKTVLKMALGDKLIAIS
jgi:hypothetical protein